MLSRTYAFFILIILVLLIQLYPESIRPDASLIAAALGVVILAGYLAGEIGARLKLPRLTGYILTGMALGPYCSGILSHSSVTHLHLIDQIALALIALSAGGEFQIHSLRKRLRGILWITLCQVVGIFFFGALSFYLISSWLPFLSSLPNTSKLAAAAIFGIIAVAQSPATTIAIINETKSAGTITETVLGITVIKDVIVIMLFTSAIPLLKIIEFNEGGFSYSFLLGLFNELFVSILVGLAAGWFISVYLRFVNTNKVVFVLAFSYLISEASHAFHLDTLIVCIAAGAWVTNASKRGTELIHMIEDSSLIIYVIFFTITGAALNLNTLQSMFGYAMLLAMIRVVWTIISTYTGAKLSRENFSSPHWLWLLFLPQAGVSLGLLSILIQEGFAWGNEMQTLMVAVIAINQIIGPILMKIGLDKCGESGQAKRRK